MARKGTELVVLHVEEPVYEEPVAPAWVLSAANRFDILAFVGIVGLANAAAERGDLAMPRERLEEMRLVLREFELYEEKFHR